MIKLFTIKLFSFKGVDKKKAAIYFNRLSIIIETSNFSLIE